MQIKFNTCSVALSLYLQDEVSSASSDGKYTADERLNAINRARQKFYLDTLGSLGYDKFIEYYPEFIDVVYKTINPKEADIKKIIKIYASSVIEEVPNVLYFDNQYDVYSKWKTSSSNRKFLEYEDKALILGSSNTISQANIIYLKQPVDIVIGPLFDDMIEPSTWLEDIIRIAYDIMISESKLVA